MTKRQPSSAGFTMVELVITLAIISLISAAAALSFPHVLDSYKLQQGATLMAGAIREAQIQAVRQNQSWRVMIDSDGRGYSLQYYSTPGRQQGDCSSVGWVDDRHERFRDGQSIDLNTLPRPCIAFGPTGAASWPNPHVITLPAYTDTTNNAGDQGLLRITDGVELNPTSPADLAIDPRYDSKTAVWYQKSPKIVVDAGEERYFRNVCIGLFAKLPNFKYPSQIKLEGTRDADTSAYPTVPSATAVWTTVYNGPGPIPPAVNNQAKITCQQIPVNGTYRFFRMTLTVTMTFGLNYVTMYEFRSTNLEFTLVGPKQSKKFTISPVTGRVTVQ